MEYKYPQIDRTTGYAWNIRQRCINELGISPTGSGDSGGFTFINFAEPLTPEQKTALDALMASNPSVPPANTCRIKIGDMWNKLAQFNANSGANFKLYYTQSVPGSGNVDTLELHTDTPLTAQQKNKVQTAYANLLNIL